MDHYFKNNPSLESNAKLITVKIKETVLKLYTDNGVFSKKGLDFGTRSLIEALPLSRINGNILDFGCGYGPIGIYIAKVTNALVDMIDVNERSIALSKKNAKLNEITANIYKSDIYECIEKKYDFIVSNPPIRVGKKILYEILFDAKKHLNSKGELWIVINVNQGAKTIIRDLSTQYKVQLVKKNKGFYIICAIND